MSQNKITKSPVDKHLKMKIIKKVDDEKLTRMAIEEIYRDTTIPKNCANESGTSGCHPCPLRKTNKRFLTNTINSVITYNKRKTINEHNKSMKRLKELNEHKRSPTNHKHKIKKDDEESRSQIINRDKFVVSKHVFSKPEKKKKIINNVSK